MKTVLPSWVSFLTLFFACLQNHAALSQVPKGIVKGVVRDSSNGETIPYASIVLEGTRLGVSASTRGFYLIPDVPEGTYHIRATAVGYQSKTKLVIVKANTTADVGFLLVPSPTELEPTTVTAERFRGQYETLPSVQPIVREEMELVPVTLESDLFRVISTMPGVVRTSDVSAQFYVRGGNGDQNLILLDGITVYNPFHGLGLFSIFDADAIKVSEFFTGGFGVEYGRRLSSVLNIVTRDGNANRLSGKFSMGFLTGHSLLEGPFPGGSWLLSARKSFFKRPLKKFLNQDVPLSFYDVIGKFTLQSTQESRFSIHFLLSNDDITHEGNSEPNYLWRNRGYGVSYEQLLGERLFVHFRLTYSRFVGQLFPQLSPGVRPQSTRVDEVNFTGDASYYVSAQSQLQAGMMWSIPSIETKLVNSADISITSSSAVTESALWLKYKFAHLYPLVIDVGARSNFVLLLSDLRYVIEPRVALRYQLSPFLAFKASYGRYHQQLMTISNEDDIISIFESWIPVPEERLEEADHYVGGVEINISERVDLTLQGYYKQFRNLFTYNRDKVDRFDPDYLPGLGKAYGGEILLKGAVDPVYGWLSYSLGRTSRTLSDFTFSPRYDRRHTINVVAGCKIGAGFEINAHWEFGSGLPFTKIVGYYDRLSLNGIFDSTLARETGAAYAIQGEKNKGLLPAYHRLDLTLTKTISIDGLRFALEVNVTNVYDRKNLFYFNRFTGDRVNMLPFFPSLVFRGEF
jgi:hypothetical protein